MSKIKQNKIKQNEKIKKFDKNKIISNIFHSNSVTIVPTQHVTKKKVEHTGNQNNKKKV